MKKQMVPAREKDRVGAAIIPVVSIAFSFLVCGVILLILKKNPVTVYGDLLKGCGLLPKGSYAGSKNMLTDFTSFLNAWTPLLFSALAVAAALKAGLFNIGVSGQMLVSGYLATVLAGYGDLPAYVAKPLVIVIGIITGALIGGLVGGLKYRFGINEVVSTIMFNYIAQYVISFFINTFYINPISRQSNPVSKAARLTLMDVKAGNIRIDIPLGIILAIAAVVWMRFFFQKTTAGFEIKAVGASRTAAKYAGMNVGKNIVLAMVISGGLAGLAGVTYYLGYFGSIGPRTLPSAGFDGIAVALLGGNQSVGIFFSSFLISIISKGSTYMSSASGVEAEIASVITGLILLISACNAYFSHRLSKMGGK